MYHLVNLIVSVMLTIGFDSGNVDAYYRSNSGIVNGQYGPNYGIVDGQYQSISGIVDPRSTRTRCNLFFATKRDQEEYNRSIVLNFYQRSFGDVDFQGAADKYVSPTEYIQHNPTIADGIPAFVAWGNTIFQGDKPKIVDIRGSAADGNFVWLHVRNTIQGADYAILDMYRLRCGKLVEHWDVVQKIGNGPFANDHPFF